MSPVQPEECDPVLKPNGVDLNSNKIHLTSENLDHVRTAMVPCVGGGGQAAREEVAEEEGRVTQGEDRPSQLKPKPRAGPQTEGGGEEAVWGWRRLRWQQVLL